MNSPLIGTTAAVETGDPSQLIEELVELFESTTVRPCEISAAVHRAKQLVRKHQSAALNLAIAVGTEVANPAYFCNEGQIRAYRHAARECDDYSLELELRYAELLLQALRQWSVRSPAAIDTVLRGKYQRATIRAQREHDELLTQIIAAAQPELAAS